MGGILVNSDHDVGSLGEPRRSSLVDLGDRPRGTEKRDAARHGPARHDDLLPALIGG
jgi:hypothetical protein